MRIKELAERVGITRQAVRFYESRGILPAPRRTPTGYRDYRPADEERLRLLLGLRALDLPLDQAGDLSALCASGRCAEVSVELRSLIAAQRARLVDRRRDLDTLDGRLAELERQLTAGVAPRPLITFGKGDANGHM